ncbi:LysE family translocator [Pseudomonas sp. 3A(2025)]
MNIALTLTYIATVLLLIATPGPVVALVVNTASRTGRRQAIATALGSNAASLVLIGVAAWLIVGSTVIAAGLLTVLSLLGCLYIAWMALAILRDTTPHTAAKNTGSGGLQRGFVVGISNPKDIIFFLAFFPQFLQISASMATSLALLSLLWVIIDLLVLGAWIVLAGTLTRRVGGRLINRCSGVALLLIAVAGVMHNLHQWMT